MAAKEIKLEHFTGQNTIEADHWLNLFEVVCAQLNLIDAEDKIVKLMSYLKDDALAFFAQRIAPGLSTLTWAEVRSLIVKRFGTPQISSIILAKERRLRKHESVKEYFDEKMKHLDKTSLVDSEKCDLLTDGVYDEFKRHLLPIIFVTTEDWLQKAIRNEMGLNRYPSHSKPSHNKDNQIKPQFQNKPHRSFNLNTQRQQRQEQQPPGPCWYCQQEGREEWHWHSLCPLKAKFGNQSTRNSSATSSHGNHLKQTKPKAIHTAQEQRSNDSSSDNEPEPLQRAGNNFAQPSDKALSGGSNGHSCPFPELYVTLNDKPIKAIVDSGSTISITTEQTFRSLHTQLIPNSKIIVEQISGISQTIGCFKAKVQIANKTAQMVFHVIPDFKYPLLLGLDIGKHFGLQIDLSSCKVSINPDHKVNEYFQPLQETQQQPPPQPKPQKPPQPRTPPQPIPQPTKQQPLHRPKKDHKTKTQPSPQPNSVANIDTGKGPSKGQVIPNCSISASENGSRHNQSNTYGKFQPNRSHQANFRTPPNKWQTNRTGQPPPTNSHFPPFNSTSFCSTLTKPLSGGKCGKPGCPGLQSRATQGSLGHH